MKQPSANTSIFGKTFAILFGLILKLKPKLLSFIKPNRERRIRRALRRHKAFAIAFAFLCISLTLITYAIVGGLDRDVLPDEYIPRLFFAFIGAVVCGFVTVILFDHYYWKEQRETEKLERHNECKVLLQEAMAHR